MNRDGSDLRILRPSIPQGLRAPTWSSDGNALFVTTIDGEQQADGSYRERSSLVRIDLMSNAEQPFLENARDLVLHAATGQIAYISPNATGTGVELRLADAAGDQQRSLIAANIFEEIAVPRFAPDGTSLIVAARGERLDQGGALDTLRGWFAPPSALAHGTPWDFWRVDLITGELRRLTAIREDEPHAAFSPTGSEIVIHGVSGIYRMNADGSQLRRIDTFGGYGGVDWAR
jgi:Tol biopolymer transport system component